MEEKEKSRVDLPRWDYAMFQDVQSKKLSAVDIARALIGTAVMKFKKGDSCQGTVFASTNVPAPRTSEAESAVGAVGYVLTTLGYKWCHETCDGRGEVNITFDFSECPVPQIEDTMSFTDAEFEAAKKAREKQRKATINRLDPVAVPIAVELAKKAKEHLAANPAAERWVTDAVMKDFEIRGRVLEILRSKGWKVGELLVIDREKSFQLQFNFTERTAPQ